jgi:hypothetical protein
MRLGVTVGCAATEGTFAVKRYWSMAEEVHA